MGVLKTFGFAALLACVTATTAATDESLMDRVTECVGRLSAQMEHQWLFSDQPTDRIEQNRAHMIDILDAMITPETATRSLAARIDAKMAHASLLTQAAFSKDTRTATWAQRRASQALKLCDGILLPSPPKMANPSDSNDPNRLKALSRDTWKASQ